MYAWYEPVLSDTVQMANGFAVLCLMILCRLMLPVYIV